MKDATSIAIVFVICLVALLLYFFLGHSALNRNNSLMAAELDKLKEEERTIQWMGSQIAEFEERLPDLKRRINYYKLAVPSQIEDEKFFSHLASELRRHDAELLELQQSGNMLWLGQLSKTEEEEYEKAGYDVNALQQIRRSTFKIRLHGDFNELLTVFENLKTLGRLYTIDQVISPAGGGGGTVLVNNVEDDAQMEITGSLFYGIPETYRDAAGLDRKYMEVAVVNFARDLSAVVKDSGQKVLSGEIDSPAGSTTEDVSSDAETEQNDAEQDLEEIQSMLPIGNFAPGGNG